MSDKPVIVAICGKSATGKDTLAKLLYNDLVKQGIAANLTISDTTREPRDNEQNGKDYNFLDKVSFLTKAINKEYLEYTKFRGWYYGTPKSAIQKEAVNIGVFNVQGLRSLLDYKKDYKIVIVYLEANLKLRLKRSYEREHKWKFEFLRRAWVDHRDFENIKNLLKKFNYRIYMEAEYYNTINLQLQKVEDYLEMMELCKW